MLSDFLYRLINLGPRLKPSPQKYFQERLARNRDIGWHSTPILARREQLHLEDMIRSEVRVFGAMLDIGAKVDGEMF